MATYNSLVSVCHLSELVEQPEDLDEGSVTMCSFCGQSCDTIRTPYPYAGDNIEINSRRYKDGDISYKDLAERIETQMRADIGDFIAQYRSQLTNDAPPMYVWDGFNDPLMQKMVKREDIK